LNGWIEIGVPDGEFESVGRRFEEDLVLLGRLDWLRSLLHHSPPRHRVLQGEAPAVLLACAMGLGTPEEAGERLPRILQPEAALAASLWLQMRAEAFDTASLKIAWRGGCLELTLACANDPEESDLRTWQRLYGQWIAESEPHRLLLRPGCFAGPEAQEENLGG
jgi:hypothetical protein